MIMPIIPIHLKNVYCYLVPAADGYLLFDCGWPHQYSLFKDNLKTAGINPADIKYLIVSHFHIDHAGLAGLLQQHAVKFTAFPNQLSEIDIMEKLISRQDYAYIPIDKQSIFTLKINESRGWLKSIGIIGEFIQIFGHGDQSIALVLDNGDALIGDLPILHQYDDLVKRDWKLLTALGAHHIYPAHAPAFTR